MPSRIDLRSDTVTTPTEGMRAALAAAPVGDDVYGEDPSVNALQEHVAGLFGRDAALFVPSGVMANVIAMRTFARPGTEVVVEADAHLVAYEDGAAALFAGIQFRTLPGTRGMLTAQQVAEALRPTSFPYTANSLVAVENTTNRAGGAVYPLGQLQAIRALADERGLAVYMDGARIWNAIVAGGGSPSEYGALADGLSFCVSKGLGAPVGSLLVGDADAMEEARVWRRRLGGAMRQVGVLAAAGRYALDHHVDRLAEDHANARRIAEIVADAAPAAVELEAVETNIVYIATGGLSAGQLVAELVDEGVLVGAMGPHLLRLVTHLDVDRDGCERAAKAIAHRLSGDPELGG